MARTNTSTNNVSKEQEFQTNGGSPHKGKRLIKKEGEENKSLKTKNRFGKQPV